MKTVGVNSSCEYEAKKSLFVAHLVPFSEFKQVRETLKAEHPKANHIVWAYRHLNEFDQVVENSSDDGEPKGTSGPPCLNVLRGNELINCAVLVVRYFGGIKLGTGGLVRAYGASVNEVINISEFEEYEKLLSVKFEVTYRLMQRFEHFFAQNNFPKGEREYNDVGAVWEMDVTKNQKLKLQDFAKEYVNVLIY